jgi:hypothetical protein
MTGEEFLHGEIRTFVADRKKWYMCEPGSDPSTDSGDSRQNLLDKACSFPPPVAPRQPYFIATPHATATRLPFATGGLLR